MVSVKVGFGKCSEIRPDRMSKIIVAQRNRGFTDIPDSCEKRRASKLHVA